MQRIADVNDQAMTPWSVGPARPVSFVLTNLGRLFEHSSSGWDWLSADVVSVSDQGIDNQGNAMVDYVTSHHIAFEFHDGAGTSFLGSGITQAKAGQGVSYVLRSDGDVAEFRDDNPRVTTVFRRAYGEEVLSIDAGTDKFGVNAVYVLDRFFAISAIMFSDTDGCHFLTFNAKQVSGGQMGNAIVLDYNGNASTYDEWSGVLTFLSGGVAQVTAGSDTTGNMTFGLVYRNGDAWEYRLASNQWTYLAIGVQALSKERLGLVDLLFGDGSADALDSSGLHFLHASIVAVA